MERRTLYFCYNHGVVAVVSEKVLEEMKAVRKTGPAWGCYPQYPLGYPSPILLFSDSPERKEFVWPLRVFEQLVKDSGATLRRASFYVPCSQPEIDERDMSLYLMNRSTLFWTFGLNELEYELPS